MAFIEACKWFFLYLVRHVPDACLTKKNLMVIRYLLILLPAILLYAGRDTSAQVYTGGSIGMHYDAGLYADISPMLGYRYGILDAGVAPFYSYREYENRPARYSYGNRIFMQLTFFRNVFAHGEYEVSNISTSTNGPDGKPLRKWIRGMPVGGGYRYNLTPKSQAYGMILYDVLLDPESPVRNPIIRAGVTFRL
jgi:hypothetical protein